MDRASLPLPNFQRAAGALRTTADELERCDNIAASTSAQMIASIVEELKLMKQMMESGFRGLNERMDKMEDRMDRIENRMDRIENRMDGIERALKVTNRNTDARLWNRGVTHDGVKLSSLFSMETGQMIEGCPVTLEQFDALTAADMTRLLRELGEPTTGNIGAKKARLGRSLGIMQRAFGQQP